jgi:galactokinase
MASGSVFLSEITTGFKTVFAADGCDFISRASGRAELIGGHTDYNEGFVIAAAIDSSYWVAARPRKDSIVRLYSEWAGETHQFDLTHRIEKVTAQAWANYGRGVIAVLIEKGYPLRGADLYMTGNVPIGGGLSSSAAMEVSIARAMLHMCGSLEDVDTVELAKVCQRAENVWAGSPCGIMDQMVSIHGRKDHAVVLDCRSLSVKYEPLDHTKCAIMIFNSMVRHEVGGGEYGIRRQMCEKAAEMIGREYPDVRALRDVDEAMLARFAGRMDEVTFRRARHVVTENARVLAGARALEKNDIVTFGRMVTGSGASARDDYEISCPEIDFLVATALACKGVYGARLMGGGFGGSAVAVVEPAMCEEIKTKVRDQYAARFGINCEVHVAEPADGTAIIDL